jgi:hypothetical protein
MSVPPPVESLEDVRARHAQRFWENFDEPSRNADTLVRAVLPPRNDADKSVRVTKGAAAGTASSLPPLVLTHGLLATLALAKARGGAPRALLLEACRFLCDPERAVLPPPSAKQEYNDELDPYIRLLTDGSDATSLRLQRATAEALAYLAALKRVPPKAA